MSDVQNCTSCELQISSSDRFCTHCGALVAQRRCDNCQNPIQNGFRFCTACGSPIATSKTTGGNGALDSLSSSLRLSLERGDPKVILANALAALSKSLDPEYAAVAFLVAMTAEAQLKHPKAAREYARLARKFYAEHLELEPSQAVRFVASGLLIDDIREIGCRAVRDEPWLYYLLGHSYGPYIPMDQLADGVVPSDICEKWGEFLDDRYEGTLRALAQILFVRGDAADAMKHFDDLILWARRYEMVYPPRIEVVWPRFLLGQCYLSVGHTEKAADTWRSICSIGHCIGGDSDDIDNAGIPWIEKAKESLLTRGCSFASASSSCQGSRHLARSVRYLLDAESHEHRDGTIDDLIESVRRAGPDYAGCLARASEEISMMEQLDKFAFVQVPIGDSTTWFRLESVQEQLLQKNALVHLSKGQTAAAVACYKQGAELWPTATGYLTLGGLQLACGLRSEAKTSYQTLIRDAKYVGSTEASDDHEDKIADARHALRELG